jgi:hypothetical protein
VVLAGGRVAGTWATRDSTLDVVLFAEAGNVPIAAIREEAVRLETFLGTSLAVSTRSS